LAKKSRQGRKKGLLKFFGGAQRVKAPSMDGVPIETVKNRREKTGSGNKPTNKERLKQTKQRYWEKKI
jgi:hypothetical protein